jgi:hypothetical protein
MHAKTDKKKEFENGDLQDETLVVSSNKSNEAKLANSC